mmetsp:Transcript_168098/g.534829  ORF Transcript_168098/g.534829 Transcript_168098/m.534829 type:complete len:317 (-) Transcript_168098:548-1498(-)
MSRRVVERSALPRGEDQHLRGLVEPVLAAMVVCRRECLEECPGVLAAERCVDRGIGVCGCCPPLELAGAPHAPCLLAIAVRALSDGTCARVGVVRGWRCDFRNSRVQNIALVTAPGIHRGGPRRPQWRQPLRRARSLGLPARCACIHVLGATSRGAFFVFGALCSDTTLRRHSLGRGVRAQLPADGSHCASGLQGGVAAGSLLDCFQIHRSRGPGVGTERDGIAVLLPPASAALGIGQRLAPRDAEAGHLVDDLGPWRRVWNYALGLGLGVRAGDYRDQSHLVLLQHQACWRRLGGRSHVRGRACQSRSEWHTRGR